MEIPEIKEIDYATAEQIIFSRKPIGLFWLKDNGVYVGIDNSTREAWTEEFSSLTACKRWLMRGKYYVEKVLPPSVSHARRLDDLHVAIRIHK